MISSWDDKYNFASKLRNSVTPDFLAMALSRGNGSRSQSQPKSKPTTKLKKEYVGSKEVYLLKHRDGKSADAVLDGPAGPSDSASSVSRTRVGVRVDRMLLEDAVSWLVRITTQLTF